MYAGLMAARGRCTLHGYGTWEYVLVPAGMGTNEERSQRGLVQMRLVPYGDIQSQLNSWRVTDRS